MRLRRNLIWICWAASALAAIALFFIPAFIIRPFTHQSARGIVVAMALRDRAPLGTLLAALVFFALTVVLWSSVKLWRRIGLGLVAVLVLFSTVMARQNYFEWMFHPVADAQFINETDSKLDAGEMILAVRFGSDARAYPISQMAYHHILNDVVEGVPVAVTY
jgi:general stress protein CsbA